ncbi:MAG: carboxypeptidase regulatory-like domain-containing protein, partial [Flavobacteriales bacterium]|nr:carboxypeptidase regulatory-like domain-containing protein [Flavobacteriales bacterium]
MKTRILSKICGLILFMPLLTFAQHNIKGVVKGSDGNPIPGVKVEINETFFKTFTNAEGEFLFVKMQAAEYSLKFSVPGFVQHNELIQIDNSDETLTIWLTENLQLIDEITVLSIRADRKVPTTYSNIKLKEI